MYQKAKGKQAQEKQLKAIRGNYARKPKKENKYDYYKVLQGNYGYGYDDLSFYDKSDRNYSKELRSDLKCYMENERGVSFRVIGRRELKKKSK